jgi:flagellar motor switch protein FliM
MNKILSQDEVDALLKSVAPPNLAESGDSMDQESTTGEPGDQSRQTPRIRATRPAAIYNFRRPDRIPKSMLRSLQLLHDKFCANVSSSLSAYLRTITEVSLLSLEQTSYNEFLASLADPTCYNALTIKPLAGMAAFEMSLDLVFPLIDRLLGGSGSLPKLSRNITEIERSLVQGVIKVIVNNLKEAWAPVSAIDFMVSASETRPQLLQIASANEIVILAIFEVKVGEVRGNMHFCIPFAALEPLSGKFKQDLSIRRKGDQTGDLRAIARSLQKATIAVTAELLGSSVTVKDLLSLKEGDVLRLDRKLSDPLFLNLAGKPKFECQPLVTQARKAVQIAAELN